MSGAILALLGTSAPTGAGGGGIGGGSTDLAIVISPDPLTWASSDGSFWASAENSISGGLAPYTTEWFLSGTGSENAVFVTTGTVTIESLYGDDAEIYCEATDALSAVATSNTITITLP